jgi:hypothetical protein
MYGLLIALALTFLIEAIALVPTVVFPPAAANPNTAPSYAVLSEADSVAGHILYYQNQALHICATSVCCTGLVNGILDPEGDTQQDYGYNYISVYNADNNDVATTWIATGDNAQFYGIVASQLNNQTQLSHYIGQYNFANSTITTASGIISMPNSVYDGNNDSVFSNAQPVIVQPVGLLTATYTSASCGGGAPPIVTD